MPNSFFENNVNNNAGTPGIFQSIAAARPAANALPVGSLFVDTTNNLIQRTDGTTWVTIGTSGGGTITGSGTVGSLPKWTSASALGNAIAGTDYVVPSELLNYLPLSGGTLTGNLTGGRFIYNTAQARTTAGLAIHNNSAQDVAIFGAGGSLNTSFLGTITATNIIRLGGTSSQFLKADGTIDSNTYATTTQLNNYLPLSGGTVTGTINGTGISLSGNAAANSFIKTGGTSSQFLKADGTIDSNTYATTTQLGNYLPLSGGTVTGTINGTDISLSGNATANSFIKTGGTASQILAADGSVITAGTNITISGGTISASGGGGGVTGSGVANQLAFWNGTSSITGSNTLTYAANAPLLINNAIIAASGVANGINITSSLTASANDDVLVGLDIQPTFFSGAFLNVVTAGIRINGLLIGQGRNSIVSNIAIGSNTTARSITTGTFNIGIGLSSLRSLTSGNSNVCVGTNTGLNITTGGFNVAVGNSAMIGNASGVTNTFNTAVGSDSLSNLLSGGSNTAIGGAALSNITTTSNNIGIGRDAGRFATASGTGTNNFNSAGCVFIGTNTRPLSFNDTNEIVIAGYIGSGDGRVGLGSNTTVLGNASTTATRIFGNLWLGTNTGSTSSSIPLTLNATGSNIGSQVLFTNDNAAAYTGISADFRGDVALQVEAAGTGTDKGLKLNTNGNNTRVYATNNGNIGLNTTTQFGSGVLVIGIANATTVPTVNPTGGGVLYVEGGALKYRGSSGTVTTIANA